MPCPDVAVALTPSSVEVTDTSPPPKGTAASGKSTSTSSNRTSANATAKDPGIAIGTEITIDGKKYRVIRRFSSGSEADLYEVKSGLKSFGLKIYRKGFHPNTKVIPLVQKLKGKGYLADVHSFGSVSVNGKSYEYELMDYYVCGPANAMNMKGKTQAILDYMFFKLNSFFFAPLGAATPDWLSVVLVYGIYLLIHALPYLPAWFARKKAKQRNTH